jgi:hypothetical protein
MKVGKCECKDGEIETCPSHLRLLFQSSPFLCCCHLPCRLIRPQFPLKCRPKKTKGMRSSTSRNAGCNLHLNPVASDTRENEKSYKKGLQEKFAHHLHLGSPIPRPAPPPGGANPGLANPTLKYRSSPLLVGVSFRSHNGLFSKTSRSVVMIFEPRLVISGVRGDA